MAADVPGLTVDNFPMRFTSLNAGPEKTEETVRTEGARESCLDSPDTVPSFYFIPVLHHVHT